tara:strand:- start:1262 stop:1720 length:459 start_codon:yes stop_codon:yes gene_type:complete
MNTLNDTWILWFHDPLDNNWKLNSYKKVCSINTINEFWSSYNFLNNKIVENSMLFLMRNNIDPLWEHKDNIKGGSWSIKLQKGNLYDIWTTISIYLINENISKKDINGISISPKKNFCIIKIWTKNNENDINTINKINNISYDGIIFKAHSI